MEIHGFTLLLLNCWGTIPATHLIRGWVGPKTDLEERWIITNLWKPLLSGTAFIFHRKGEQVVKAVVTGVQSHITLTNTFIMQKANGLSTIQAEFSTDR